MASAKLVMDRRNPKSLKDHPKNKEIYDAAIPEEFLESIKKHGVKEPLQVLSNDVIIGGHRRKRAAIQAGIEQVPVIVRHDVDPNDAQAVEELLVVLNEQRLKTNEEKAREFAVLLEVEKKRVKEASEAGDPLFVGRKAEVAAKKVGLSHPSATKAAKVVEKIDELKASGNTISAEELKAKLNKSIKTAAKSLEDKKATPFDDSIAMVEWVLKTAVPKVQEYAIQIERSSGRHGTIASGRVANAMKVVFEEFDGARRLLENARQKSLK